MIEESPIRKRPLRRPKLRREDRVKREVERIEPGTKCREAAEDRETFIVVSMV